MKPFRFHLGKLELALLEATDPSYSESYFARFLSPSEIELAQKFKHPLRKLEFLAARALLHKLETKLPPILCTESGSPLWPSEYKGSISHKNGWVLVSLAKNFSSLGVDLEEPEKFPLSVSNLIASAEELKLSHHFENQQEFLALIFSAKESFFKCCYPHCEIWFGFHDAKVLSIDFTKGTFEIQLLRDLSKELLAGKIFSGFFKQDVWKERKFIITAIANSFSRGTYVSNH